MSNSLVGVNPNQSSQYIKCNNSLPTMIWSSPQMGQGMGLKQKKSGQGAHTNRGACANKIIPLMQLQRVMHACAAGFLTKRDANHRVDESAVEELVARHAARKQGA